MRDLALDFELELSSLASEESRDWDWGRSFLSPGLPLVWDASRILIERAGMSAHEVAAAADEAMQPFAHRTVAVRDEAEGKRLAAAIEVLPGWSSERTLYLAWEEESGRSGDAEVEEAPLAQCEASRRQLIRDGFPEGMAGLEETAEQLLTWNRRFSAAGGDRWFLAPAGAATSACCLLARGGVGQIEEVVTLEAARGQGLAQAIVLAALAASRADANRVTFVAVDADDWPLQMYEKLGFAIRGELTTLRRLPT